MTTIPNVFITPPQIGCLRPFDMRRDLKAVADLVEDSFRGTIDPDGKRYLNQMRSAAQNRSFLSWASSVVENTSLPLSGYVWEEAGKVVGNLSLLPFSYNSQRLYLIANVAVHPKYRRQGIARSLTSAALDHARSRAAAAAWLHVREENEPAVRLYQSMGFQERARRTTWQNWGSRSENQLQGESWIELASQYQLTIGPRRAEHWDQQCIWLNRLYPPGLSWYFPFDSLSLRPGLWAYLQGFFTGRVQQHWSVQQNGRLLGTVTRQQSNSYADNLWLALPEACEPPAVEALLKFARSQINPRRPLAIDFPSREAAHALKSAGFNVHQTLIWMVVPF
jgi:ribosomal protein S18 acetylase RimI-like enzyme